jgi:hypothetical protein
MACTGTYLLYFQLEFMLIRHMHARTHAQVHARTRTHTRARTDTWLKYFTDWPKGCLPTFVVYSTSTSFTQHSKRQQLTGCFLCFHLYPHCQHGVVHTTQHDVEWDHGKRNGNSTANCSETSWCGGVWPHSCTVKSRYCHIYCSITNLQVNSIFQVRTQNFSLGGLSLMLYTIYVWF